MPPASEGHYGGWPTLGFLKADWVEAHCPVPDGFRRGEPFRAYDWQLRCDVNHYRVRADAEVGQLGPAFVYRRSQVVAPQKIGKGPWSATTCLFEAAGPAVFAGFAKGGEVFDCRAEHDCDFVYVYGPGEAMGRLWPTPLVQLLATSEDQTDNVYRPLQAMVKLGPLSSVMRVGEEFTRIGEHGRIDVVTSSATARLGNPVTFAMQDETGIYTQRNGMRKVAETMRRGVAGMGGRVQETTNAWDPAEDSTAQRTAESQRPDIFRFHRLPPPGLSYRNREHRRRIHRHVYAGSLTTDRIELADGSVVRGHVDLDAIEAEAAELLEKDPEQAERFYGNMLVQGAGAWLSDDLWADAYAGASS